MLIVREIFVAKPGQASKLAKLMKEMFEHDPSFKGHVMTDMIGDYNTVVCQYEAGSMAEWEKSMEDQAKIQYPPDLQERMKGYTDMYLTGRREVFRVW